MAGGPSFRVERVHANGSALPVATFWAHDMADLRTYDDVGRVLSKRVVGMRPPQTGYARVWTNGTGAAGLRALNSMDDLDNTNRRGFAHRTVPRRLPTSGTFMFEVVLGAEVYAVYWETTRA